MYKIMTAGPTQVKENVRMARSLECTNPDLDIEFFDFYKETCQMLSKVTNTNNEAFLGSLTKWDNTMESVLRGKAP